MGLTASTGSNGLGRTGQWRLWTEERYRGYRMVSYESERHDDVIKWKHFPRYWPFVRGIHRSTVNSPVHGEFPAQRPVKRSFDVFFDLRLNKRLSKQSWGWWSETPSSSSLWRHRNVYVNACLYNDTFWCTSIHIANIRQSGDRRSIIMEIHIDGLVQYGSNSIANALELLQCCTKPSINVRRSIQLMLQNSSRYVDTVMGTYPGMGIPLLSLLYGFTV